jgi:hypothetical protein
MPGGNSGLLAEGQASKELMALGCTLGLALLSGYLIGGWRRGDCCPGCCCLGIGR